MPLRLTRAAIAPIKGVLNTSTQKPGSGITSSGLCASDAEKRSADLKILTGLHFVTAAEGSFFQRQSFTMIPVAGGTPTPGRGNISFKGLQPVFGFIIQPNF